MSDAALERVIVREAVGEDAGRLALVSDATFLETFAGMISGDALVTHCQTRHAPAYLSGLLKGGARAWLAELDGAPIGYALLTAQAFEHDADLLFGRELPARAATDLPHCGFSGLLAFLAHLETLLGARNPVKCLLV